MKKPHFISFRAYGAQMGTGLALCLAVFSSPAHAGTKATSAAQQTAVSQGMNAAPPSSPTASPMADAQDGVFSNSMSSQRTKRRTARQVAHSGATAPSLSTPTELRIAHADASSFQQGSASWYGDQFHNRRTANGERYDMHALTAAHKTLPFGTLVRVVSPTTGKSVVVRINDRGPYVKGRVIDLSRAAAERLGVHGHGVYKVVLYRATRGDQKAQQLALKDDDE